jgi:hypothetical protein
LDVQINEVHSQVRAVDSKALLDPMVMRQIVKACVKAVREDQARQKHLADERSLTPSASSGK